MSARSNGTRQADEKLYKEAVGLAASVFGLLIALIRLAVVLVTGVTRVAHVWLGGATRSAASRAQAVTHAVAPRMAAVVEPSCPTQRSAVQAVPAVAPTAPPAPVRAVAPTINMAQEAAEAAEAVGLCPTEPALDVAPIVATVRGVGSPRLRLVTPKRYAMPRVDCLEASAPEVEDPSAEAARKAEAAKLLETLSRYGVEGSVDAVRTGPTVTTYEVTPVAGTKVKTVAALADDLSLAMGRKVRIQAPIPGTTRVGFELPNARRGKVSVRDLIEDPRFAAFDGALPVVLGKDTMGEPVYADLAAMPHVIVAGATGSGKSVGLNVMLLSMLYRRSPEELRFLMIDPKVVELAPFERIPHMLQPVVTDMGKAAQALQWAVGEMERRYQLFAATGSRNIGSYNGKVERGEVSSAKLPSIVIVIDEFADLMAQQGKGKEVESAVSRLAQKARAAGMHVILATQRPSVDVLTGTIKANFPTRIAYRVAQKVDSRTILDDQGAEHLVGAGDMLVKLADGETKRVQCPWVSEDEVGRVTAFLRAQGEPVYEDGVFAAQPEASGSRPRRAGNAA